MVPNPLSGQRKPIQSPWTYATTSEFQGNHERVYNCVAAHPGVHLRKVSRDLDLAIGDVQYHLGRLEKEGKIRSTKHGLYRFFYSSDLFGEEDGPILAALSQATPRELLLHLVEHPDMTQESLAEAAKLSQPTVSWHMKRLADLGLIQRSQRGRSVAYRVNGNSLQIALFIRNYHPGVWERWSGRLTEIILAFGSERDAHR